MTERIVVPKETVNAAEHHALQGVRNAVMQTLPMTTVNQTVNVPGIAVIASAVAAARTMSVTITAIVVHVTIPARTVVMTDHAMMSVLVTATVVSAVAVARTEAVAITAKNPVTVNVKAIVMRAHVAEVVVVIHL